MLKVRIYKLLTKLFVLVILGLQTVPAVYALELVISDNGSGSSSEIVVNSQSTTSVEQINNADVSNNATVSENTGGNVVDGNTSSAVSVDTGNISTEVAIENSLNTSVIEGGCCSDSVGVSITDNGAGSINKIDLGLQNETNISVVQNAEIVNTVSGNSNTGENTASDNSGNVSIQTGNIFATGTITNGPINGSYIKNFSSAFEIETKVNANGSNSINLLTANLSNFTRSDVLNTASVLNNMNWWLNTGKNESNGNNGDVVVSTGDILLDLFIKNNPINFSFLENNCCEIFDPGNNDEDGNGGDDTPEQPGIGGQEVSNGGGGGSSNGGGSILPSAAATEAGGPGVVGLSDTSSKEAKAVFFWAALGMIALGSSLIGNGISGNIFTNKDAKFL